MDGQTCSFMAYASTPSSRVEYCVNFADTVPSDFVSFVDISKFEQRCKTGCPNFAHKWSCPPYAPRFQDFTEGWGHLTVVFLTVELGQFSYTKNDYLKIKAANSILKSRADRFLREMAPKVGRYITTGSCRLCKSCGCKTGQACSHPDKMSFSYEAMGMDVGALVEKVFGRDLMWYKRGQLPKDTSVVCGLLSKEPLSLEYLREEYRRVIGD